ncbi:probable pyruvate dehydrogenase E1 component subunit alpha, mitochondrial [Ceratitis capitata]|uniref:probable pyruvate dehydrogenase E1 component subunit alpha, mitochondrial n=1 Tax=Ceratitis capitata TaxID=7213 RepID=UPI000C6C7738|nr:probable pyruvate dehydrogenase E1 component subunit alpha, mitochondrial [Ceratitis capitata]
MRETDHLITAYRCHGWCYVMGIKPRDREIQFSEGMGTKINRSSCSIGYYARAVPLPGIYVGGMDILAIDFVQKEGPIIIGAHTYRFFGHSMSDPGTSYRTLDFDLEIFFLSCLLNTYVHISLSI